MARAIIGGRIMFHLLEEMAPEVLKAGEKHQMDFYAMVNEELNLQLDPEEDTLHDMVYQFSLGLSEYARARAH